MVQPAEVLRHGDLEVEGRLVVASNLTVLATARLDGAQLRCVYKPIAGESPLWDFPDGTLAAREVAAYEVSTATGWNVVPLTVLRDTGPLGPGMCQMWIDQDEKARPWVDVTAPDQVGDDVLPVLEAVDGDGAPVVVVHRDHPDLRRLALFDAVVNNADRKGGHILHGPGSSGSAPTGSVPTGGASALGVDHGVSFHVEPKLRTVLWGWAGQPLTGEERSVLTDLEAGLTEPDGPVRRSLATLLDASEVDALADRVAGLLATGALPHPTGRMPVPWPVL